MRRLIPYRNNQDKRFREKIKGTLVKNRFMDLQFAQNGVILQVNRKTKQKNIFGLMDPEKKRNFDVGHSRKWMLSLNYIPAGT